MECWNSAGFALPPALSPFPYEFQNEVLHALPRIFLFLKNQQHKPRKVPLSDSPPSTTPKLNIWNCKRPFWPWKYKVRYTQTFKSTHCTAPTQWDPQLLPCRTDTRHPLLPPAKLSKGRHTKEGDSLSFSQMLGEGIFTTAARHREC